MENYIYPNKSREELIAFLPSNYQKVLEIGCGTGGFKNTLKQDIEIWGVEPNKNAAIEASDKGYKVLVGLYDEVCENLPNHYFDLVICNDVIEHMVDHEQFLNTIKQKMNTQACIVGSIPNIRNYTILIQLLILKDWQYTEEGILDNTHLRFFTAKSLKRAFAKTNYNIEKFNGINNNLICWPTFKSTMKYLFIQTLRLMSFGHFEDIKYTQFGFRISPNER